MRAPACASTTSTNILNPRARQGVQPPISDIFVNYKKIMKIIQNDVFGQASKSTPKNTTKHKCTYKNKKITHKV